jgi:hypothetical protein
MVVLSFRYAANESKHNCESRNGNHKVVGRETSFPEKFATHITTSASSTQSSCSGTSVTLTSRRTSSFVTRAVPGGNTIACFGCTR